VDGSDILQAAELLVVRRCLGGELAYYEIHPV